MGNSDFTEMLVLSKLVELNINQCQYENGVFYIEDGGRKFNFDNMKKRLSELIDKYLEKYVIDDSPKGN